MYLLDVKCIASDETNDGLIKLIAGRSAPEFNDNTVFNQSSAQVFCWDILPTIFINIKGRLSGE